MRGKKSGSQLRGLVDQLEVALANSLSFVTGEDLLLRVDRRNARVDIVLLALSITTNDSVMFDGRHGSLS